MERPDRRRAASKGTHVPDRASCTISDAGKLWLETCEANKLERATTDAYRNHLDLHIKPFIGDTLISRLNVPAVRSFEDKLRTDGRSEAMVKRVVSSHANIINRGLVPAMIGGGVTIVTGKKDEDGKPILAAKYTGMHALRHFYASWCINPVASGGMGLSPKEVQERSRGRDLINALPKDTVGRAAGGPPETPHAANPIEVEVPKDSETPLLENSHAWLLLDQVMEEASALVADQVVRGTRPAMAATQSEIDFLIARWAIETGIEIDTIIRFLDARRPTKSDDYGRRTVEAARRYLQRINPTDDITFGM